VDAAARAHAIRATVDALLDLRAALDVPAEWHVSAGIGHGIDQDGLRYGGEFLAKQFAR